MKINRAVKENAALTLLYYMLIIAGTILMFLFSESGETNYIYNQFKKSSIGL